MNRIDLTWLADFLALNESRSFSRAADRRHFTQPAFSRRIQALEQWAGASLFERGGRDVTLTEPGRRSCPGRKRCCSRSTRRAPTCGRGCRRRSTRCASPPPIPCR